MVLVPTWSIVPSRFWKAQVGFLARHYRVVTFDGRGSGRSGPAGGRGRVHGRGVRRGHRRRAGRDRRPTQAVLVTRVVRGVLGGARRRRAPRPGARPLRDRPVVRAATWRPRAATTCRGTSRSTTPRAGRSTTSTTGSAAATTTSSTSSSRRCSPSRTRPSRSRTASAGRTRSRRRRSRTPPPAGSGCDGAVCEPIAPLAPAGARARSSCVHGTDDRIRPHAFGERLAELTGGDAGPARGRRARPVGARPGEGQPPDRAVRRPARIRAAARRHVGAAPRPTADARSTSRRPSGSGTPSATSRSRPSCARGSPDLQIDWLAQHPVTRVLAQHGERVHPASAWLRNESGHIEHEAGEHDLHAFQAIRRMDEILVHNFMVFDEVVADGDYDLVIGDEAWDVDYFLHENPELKRFSFAWMTDFVGWLPMPDGGAARGGADRRLQRGDDRAARPVRARAGPVGVRRRPRRRRRGRLRPRAAEHPRRGREENFDFAGYVTGFDPAAAGGHRAAARRRWASGRTRSSAW